MLIIYNLTQYYSTALVKCVINAIRGYMCIFQLIQVIFTSRSLRVTGTEKSPRSYRCTSSLIIHFQRKHTQDFSGWFLHTCINNVYFITSNHSKLICVQALTVPQMSGCSVFLDYILPILHLKSVCRAMCTRLSCILSRDFIL